MMFVDADIIFFIKILIEWFLSVYINKQISTNYINA